MIFGSDGALTGVKGVTAVAALIKGLDIPTSTSGTDLPPSDRDQDVEENSNSSEGTIIQLSDIPFTGLFRVGKKF